jgi:hypothetical protein
VDPVENCVAGGKSGLFATKVAEQVLQSERGRRGARATHGAISGTG